MYIYSCVTNDYLEESFLFVNSVKLF